MTPRGLQTFGVHGILVVCALSVVLPVAWIALASLKTQIALLQGDVLFSPYLGHFHELLFSRSSDYLRHFGNSLLVASLSTALVLVISTLADPSSFKNARPSMSTPSAAPSAGVVSRGVPGTRRNAG